MTVSSKYNGSFNHKKKYVVQSDHVTQIYETIITINPRFYKYKLKPLFIFLYNWRINKPRVDSGHDPFSDV